MPLIHDGVYLAVDLELQVHLLGHAAHQAGHYLPLVPAVAPLFEYQFRCLIREYEVLGDINDHEQVGVFQFLFGIFGGVQLDIQVFDFPEPFQEYRRVFASLVLVDDMGGAVEHGVAAEGAVHQGEEDDGQEQAEAKVGLVPQIASDFL
jgi:hypothetical protein